MSPNFKAFLVLVTILIIGLLAAVVVLQSDFGFKASASFDIRIIPRKETSKEEFSAGITLPNGDTKAISLAYFTTRYRDFAPQGMDILVVQGVHTTQTNN